MPKGFCGEEKVGKHCTRLSSLIRNKLIRSKRNSKIIINIIEYKLGYPALLVFTRPSARPPSSPLTSPSGHFRMFSPVF